MFHGESYPVLLVKRERKYDSLHLSKHSLGVTLNWVSPSFFSQTDRFCHCSCPAGEVPQLDMGEKTNKTLKLPPPSPTLLASFCRSELLVSVGESCFSAGQRTAPASCLPPQQRHQLLFRSYRFLRGNPDPEAVGAAWSWALLSDPNPRLEIESNWK